MIRWTGTTTAKAMKPTSRMARRAAAGAATAARRSLRPRNPVRKARIQGTTKAGVEAKITQVQYKEGELLSDHLKTGDGTLLEVKIPAECTVSTNLQVRTRQVWGTDTYTSDSDLVAVLMHTGYYLPSLTIPPSLLEVRAVVRAMPQEDGYASTSRNGIRSRSWGAVKAGCSYKLESCRAVTVNGTSIDLEPSPLRISQVVPTYFPNHVEAVINTRSSAANSERRQKLIQEVTVQYNLCNEPWLKYSIAAVADQGFKRSQWTSARLRRDTLYLETHSQRFELSWDGEEQGGDSEGGGGGGSGEAAAGGGEGGAAGAVAEDTYRWARCITPLPLGVTRSLGIPLPKDTLTDVKAGLKWDEIKWGSASVDVAGTEYTIVRLHFLSRTYE